MLIRLDEPRSALKRKLGAVVRLTKTEHACLDAMQAKVRRVPAGTEIVRDGEPYAHAYIVNDGWAIRFKSLSDGRRQILNFALPGDVIGLFSALFEVADHSVAALTDIEIHPVEPTKLVTMFGTCPRLGAAVAWAAGREESILAEQVVRIGRRSAYERMAHIVIELLHRLRLVGVVDHHSFELPLTQEILADTLGLSVVHVNRTLRRLRDDGLLRMKGDRVAIEDLDRLSQIAEFSPHYLAAAPLPRGTEAALAG
jgi:CRP-like cAMP-binding protein